ncbi:hypothetical protein HU200_058089 [Digitaria exilis]|uniref:U-box domain-containing protein n=1 Tax=Digitaria exilis TaxID=1010633 RepID=A0A835AG69_9POAL|nr:hypothetical protein HU200_058089 [Digitaria exilis]
MEEVEVPCYFVCPISLQLMRDPVTLPSGITYDRDGIERWLLTAGSCPVTKQPVPEDLEPTPNHTLRRLIHSWAAIHSFAAHAIQTPPKPATDRGRVASLVSRVAAAAAAAAKTTKWSSSELLAALRELRDVAAESERSRKLVAAVPGVADALFAVLVASGDGEALEIICSLQLPEQCLLRAIETNDSELVDALVSALQRSNAASREHAALLLQKVMSLSPNRNLPEQVFLEVVQLLRDKQQVSKAATKAALHVLAGATPWGRNRVKAVDAGAVPVLVDMLLELEERRACELALGALDRLCGCAEGRAELVAHGAGVAAVGALMMRVSDVTTDKAVRVLRSLARHAATPAVLQEMAQTGAVGTLCVVAAQSSEHCCYSQRTRERARETLRLHARAWRTSPCLHRHLQAIYPDC